MSDQSAQIPQFQILRTKQQFEELEAEWNVLFENHGSGSQLFQTFNWIWHWINQFETEPNNILILIGRLDDELVIAAPLVLENTYGFKIIKWIGEPVSQYGDILIKDDTNNLIWLKQGFAYLVETIKPDLFYMRKTRFDAAITPLLENYGATVLEETAAPYIDLLGAETFIEFNKRYSQRSRKAKRRHRRKLEERGDLKFSLFTAGPEANQAAKHAINLKRSWLQALGIISPAFKGTIIDQFFDNASKENPHPVGLLVSELVVEDRPAAIEIGIKVKNYYGAHLGAYDPDFIAHSPGSLQMQDTIEALIKEGVQIIDLFAPNDGYKLEWTNQSVPVFDFAYSVSLKGKLFEKAYLNYTRPALKRLANKLSERKKARSKAQTSEKDKSSKTAKLKTHSSTEPKTAPKTKPQASE